MGRRQKVSKSEDLPKHQNIKAFGLKARHITTFWQRYIQFFIYPGFEVHSQRMFNL